MTDCATTSSLIESIDRLLPQTQCRKCGYDGCKPYARAIVDGDADINQCPPGGEAGIKELAALLGKPFKPLSAVHGVEKPRAVAFIDENACIGCTLCIQACPVDAIVGAGKQMHTVAAPLCTGCELCLAPCPIDCISMEPLSEATGPRSREQVKAEADAARGRYEFRNLRIEREEREKAQRLAARLTSGPSTLFGNAAPADGASAQDRETAAATSWKKTLIAAAIERARAQRARMKTRKTGQ